MVRPGGTPEPSLGDRANAVSPASTHPGSRPNGPGHRVTASGPGVASKRGFKERA